MLQEEGYGYSRVNEVEREDRRMCVDVEVRWICAMTKFTVSAVGEIGAVRCGAGGGKRAAAEQDLCQAVTMGWVERRMKRREEKDLQY